MNEKIFILVNHYTNIGILPLILKYISGIFFIANFAFFYLIACIYFYFKIRQPHNMQRQFTSIYYPLVKGGVCYAIFGFTYAALKFSVNMPRPFCSLPESAFTTILDINAERCLSSFPSAHTGLSIMIAYLLWPYMNKWQKIFGVIIVLAVATARITLAMHYPADILYSTLIVVIVIMIANFIFKLFRNNLIKMVGEFIASCICE